MVSVDPWGSIDQKRSYDTRFRGSDEIRFSTAFLEIEVHAESS
jgi:hypothetical protein